jgi:hypothetical protein
LPIELLASNTMLIASPLLEETHVLFELMRGELVLVSFLRSNFGGST